MGLPIFTYVWIVAVVLLLVVCLSAPIEESIYFLRAFNGGREYHFGVFGYTGIHARIGYHFPVTLGNSSTSNALDSCTSVLIFHLLAVIAFVLSGVGFCVGGRGCIIFAGHCWAFVLLFTLSVFILDMFLFSAVRNEFRKLGWSSEYGNAIWLTLGALCTLVLGLVSEWLIV